MTIVGEYKGHPTLTLKRDENDRYPFSFGLAKAQLILAHIQEIEAFVAEHSNEKEIQI